MILLLEGVLGWREWNGLEVVYTVQNERVMRDEDYVQSMTRQEDDKRELSMLGVEDV